MKKTELITDINEMSTEEKLLADAPKLTVAELIRILAPKYNSQIGDSITIRWYDSTTKRLLAWMFMNVFYDELYDESDPLKTVAYDEWLVDRFEWCSPFTIEMHVTVPQEKRKS